MPSRPRFLQCLLASLFLHVVVFLAVPIGTPEPRGKMFWRRISSTSPVKFIKIFEPPPRPEKKPTPAKAKQRVRVRRHRVVRRRPRRRPKRVVQKPPTPPALPEPPRPDVDRPAEAPALEAKLLPPPKPELAEPEPMPTPPPVPVEQPRPEAERAPAESPELRPEMAQPVEPAETAREVAETPAGLQPTAPQPVAEKHLEPADMKVPGPVSESPALRLAALPTEAVPGAPTAKREEPASGPLTETQPNIGLPLGEEARSALPGSQDVKGTPQAAPAPVFGPGGQPASVAVGPLEAPTNKPSGPKALRGVAWGEVGTPGARRGEPGEPGDYAGGLRPSLAREFDRPGDGRSPGQAGGGTPGPAGPPAGAPVRVAMAPHGDRAVAPMGPQRGGAEGGGQPRAQITLGGEGGTGGGPRGRRGMGGEGGGGGSGAGTGSPRLGVEFGGRTGSPFARRGGSGGVGEGGPGGGYGGGEGGPGQGGRGGPVSTPGGRGAGGPGTEPGPLGLPTGTEKEGVPGYAWLPVGKGVPGGLGGEGFGGPHRRGMGGGHGGPRVDSPDIGGVPEGRGAGPPGGKTVGQGGRGGEGKEPGGPGSLGPLRVGQGITGKPGPAGLLIGAAVGRGIPLLPPGWGKHAVPGTPGAPKAARTLPSGTRILPGLGTGAASPGGLYVDLTGTFYMPMGVTNSDYNVDAVGVENLLNEIRKRTKVRVTVTRREVPLTYENIKDSPILYLVGHKAFQFSDAERAALRKYVESGGTIFGEDCHGPFGSCFPAEMRRIFGRPLRQIPLNDELFKSFYVLNRVPPGDMQERYPLQGLQRPDGTWAVIWSRNDYGCAWKAAPGSYVLPPTKEEAFRMGVNIYIYTLAHWRR